MASSSFRRNKSSPPAAIRFFKIILRESLEDGNLKIPNKFTRKYGGGVANPVYLKPPDGTEWKVDWTKHDGGILFENGWKEFATYYSLDHGHLLWFEYNETSHFKVRILDMSGLEIYYPFNDQINEDLVEILNEPLPQCPGQLKKRLEAPISSPSASKQLRTAKKRRDVERSPNLQGSQSEQTNLEMPVIASVNQDSDEPAFKPGTCWFRSLKEAQKFNLENPSFTVKIGRSNLQRSRACLPVAFFRKYFGKKEQNVKIQFGSKLWSVKLLYYPLLSIAYISTGWRPFALASNLKAGDVCVFELINGKDPVLDVHIYRAHG